MTEFVKSKGEYLFSAVQSTDLYLATHFLVKTGWRSIATTTTTARPRAASNASISKRSTWTSPRLVRSKDYPDPGSDRRSGKLSRIMDDVWQRILKDLRHRLQVIPKRKNMSGDHIETSDRRLKLHWHIRFQFAITVQPNVLFWSQFHLTCYVNVQ